MAIHRNKRFVGVGKQARRHEGHLEAELPPKARNVPLQARNVFPQARIVPKKSNRPSATGVHFGACIPQN